MAQPAMAQTPKLFFAGTLFFLSSLGATTTAHAINAADGTTGEWTNPAVWSGNVPTTSDGENDVVLFNGATVTLTGGTAGAYDRVIVGDGGSINTANTLTINGGTFTAAGISTSGDVFGEDAFRVGDGCQQWRHSQFRR